MIVVPVVALMLAQGSGVIFLGPGLLMAMGGVFVVIAVVVLRFGSSSVSRARLGRRL